MRRPEQQGDQERLFSFRCTPLEESLKEYNTVNMKKVAKDMHKIADLITVG